MKQTACRILKGIFILTFVLSMTAALKAQTLETFFVDGGVYSELVQGSDGNFYGTTYDGGTNGDGTVFKITSEGDMTTLVSFTQNNGAFPVGKLAQGEDGYFYGTTGVGGGNEGYGTIFKMTLEGHLTTLVSFVEGGGYYPYAGLVEASDGNFYGTTEGGGTNGYGTVFRMTPEGLLTTMVSFAGTNGSFPYAGLVQASEGQFYGTTTGGSSTNDFGTIFKMTLEGHLTTLVFFTMDNGAFPQGELVEGSDGNFYGTTPDGGTDRNGTVFRMTPTGELTTLVFFTESNGSGPTTRLIQGTDGNFYGTTSGGGADGYGTVFRMTPTGSLTTLVSFDGFNAGYPEEGLVQGKDGKFYGTAGNFFRINDPGISKQPGVFSANIGGTATFNVVASGTGTFSYQWSKAGNPIDGATNSSLTITNIQALDAGNYSITVSNHLSTSTSADGILILDMPLVDALDNPALNWLSGGNAPWFPQTAVSHDGVDAAQSGLIIDGEGCWIETTVVGPGVLNFRWKMDSVGFCDFMEFYINGVLQEDVISGAGEWEKKTLNLNSGTNVLRWRYVNNCFFTESSNRSWVDRVTFVPLESLPKIDRASLNFNGSQFDFKINAPAGTIVVIDVSTNLVNWVPIHTNTLGGGPLHFSDPQSSNNAARYYRLSTP